MDNDYASYYSRLESEHWWWVGRRRILNRYLDSLPLPRPADGGKLALMELGCASGYNVLGLQERYDCVCLEPDDVLRAQAQKLLKCPVEFGMLPDQANVYERQFDIILLMDVLEHVEQDAEALVAIRKLLKPGGFLVLNVPALQWMWSNHDDMNQHFRRYHRPALRTLIDGAGYDVKTLRYWGHGLIAPAFLARQMSLDSGNKDRLVHIPSPTVNGIMQRLVNVESIVTSVTPWLPGLSLFGIAQNPA